MLLSYSLSTMFLAIGDLEGNTLGSVFGSPAVGGVTRLCSCLNKNTIQVNICFYVNAIIQSEVPLSIDKHK